MSSDPILDLLSAIAGSDKAKADDVRAQFAPEGDSWSYKDVGGPEGMMNYLVRLGQSKPDADPAVDARARALAKLSSPDSILALATGNVSNDMVDPATGQVISETSKGSFSKTGNGSGYLMGRDPADLHFESMLRKVTDPAQKAELQNQRMSAKASAENAAAARDIQRMEAESQQGLRDAEVSSRAESKRKLQGENDQKEAARLKAGMPFDADTVSRFRDFAKAFKLQTGRDFPALDAQETPDFQTAATHSNFQSVPGIGPFLALIEAAMRNKYETNNDQYGLLEKEGVVKNHDDYQQLLSAIMRSAGKSGK